MKTKVCSKCKRKLSIDNFYKTPNNADGLYSHCKKCHAEYNKQVQINKRNGVMPIKRKRTICKIIKQHHTILKNDPERLNSKFMLNIINGEI